MTLDSRLNWEEHNNKLRVKAIRTLNIIKVVQEKKWERDWKALKQLYSAICRSKMDYACQLYNTAYAGRLKKLEGIRIYTEAFKTTSVEALHVKANDLPLELRRNEEMNQTHQPLWLVNIFFCYEGETH